MTAVSATLSADRQNGSRDDRKLRKPLIERKRRERINHCLEQLRETLVGVFGLDQQSKLEKADILEMTVKHLQNIQSNRVTTERQTESVQDPEVQQRFSTGYIQCMHEVHNLLLSCDWMDKTLGARLLNHLLRSLPKSTPSKPSFTSSEPETLQICEVELSPPSVIPPTQTNHHALLTRPPPTKSPQITAVEMWRPW
ncbi:Transcription cofactor HES-6 [Bagarius yarrelli]|uniref:Transcription cofactor HES-6 n=1 Tax=Bagarius yarrelli TaxID=175774 RepID=A0A556U756_BAGYA|nr:Transcription cofactor HES-6 [Bagarius yarrelli]